MKLRNCIKSWVDHFVQLCEKDIEYANFAKRGLVTEEIRLQQLEKALTFNPDLVSLIAGANDVLKDVGIMMYIRTIWNL